MGLQERGHEGAEERGDGGNGPRGLLEGASEALKRRVFAHAVLQGRHGIWGEPTVAKCADVVGDAGGSGGTGERGRERLGCGGVIAKNDGDDAAAGASGPVELLNESIGE